MATPPPSDQSRPTSPSRPRTSGSTGPVKRVSSNPTQRSATRPGNRPPSPPTSRGGANRPRTSGTAPGSVSRAERRPSAAHQAYVPEPPARESSWHAFFRPVRSSRQGTMPAGMVLVVVVASMLIAMFLSADAISRKASGRRNNAEYRKTVASDIAKFSDTLKISAPANAVACAAAPYLSRTCAAGEQSTEELLAAKQQEEGATGPDGAANPAAGVTPTTVDKTPKVRVPTLANPLKVWVGGDSISYEPGVALQNFSADSKLYNVTTDARASTGLTRDDYFNWPAHLVKDVTGTKPDVMFIMFGGNDAQGIVTNGGAGGILYGTPEWQATYRKRVGDTMDLLRSNTNDRLVIWMGMPPVSDTSGVKNVEMLNYIYATEAAKRPWVKYFDSFPFFADPSGAFTFTLPAADGHEQTLRAKDGVHFSFDGGIRMGWAVYAKFASLVDLSAAPLTPDPAEAPPPDIKERAEIPPAANQVIPPP